MLSGFSKVEDSPEDGACDELLEADARFVWHPFTQHSSHQKPLCIKSAKGSQLFDARGNAYLDMISSWWVNIHGHCDPEINAALTQQLSNLEHVMFAGFTHEPGVRMAKALSDSLPGTLSKVFYSDNGSTAVEVALKIAYQFWLNKGVKNRRRIAALTKGYHGDTFGAMSGGKGTGYFRHFHDMLFSVDFLPVAETWNGDTEVQTREADALVVIEQHFEQHGNETCAIIMEPLIQGAGGMRMYSEFFLLQITSIARRFGVLVIFDEVMTGFGRTGKLFASELLDDPPDLVCLSKGLTAGYMPLGITVVKDMIFEAFVGDSPFVSFAHSPGGPMTRRLIVISVLFTVFIAPFILAAFFPQTPVFYAYAEKTRGFWFIFESSDKMRFEQMAGYVILPVHTRMAAAISGFYFGGGLAK